MPRSASPIKEALQRWRSNLLDLSPRNPLISLDAAGDDLLQIVQPGGQDVVDYLVRGGKPWRFHLAPEKGRYGNEPTQPWPDELVTNRTDRKYLTRVLTRLYRRSQAGLRERGQHILCLAFGVLEWRDADGAPLRAPLLLLPVGLRRNAAREPFALYPIDGESALVNPALSVRLQTDFALQVPAASIDDSETSLAGYFARVTAAVSQRPGWAVRPDLSLALFSVAEGVIFQDLQESAERLAARPLVQKIAGAPVALPEAEAPDERNPDAEQEPRVDAILDADSDQRLCLEAAARGDSFVVIGPPGTGKSQTIANLIADRIAHGQRVLFISNKKAALAEVAQRLRAVGLGDGCLKVYGANAAPHAVLAELAACLATPPAAVTPAASAELARLPELRDQLNRYVRALHQVRTPVQRSAWDVLAELPRWREVPLLPLGLPASRSDGQDAAQLTLAECTPAHLDELTGSLQRLQALWHVGADANFPWRGFKSERYSQQLRDELLSLIDRIRGRADKLRVAAELYGKQLGVRGSVTDLLKLGDLLEKRPPHVDARWLRAGDLPALAAEVDRGADQYQRLTQARQPLAERYGLTLWSLPEGTAIRTEQAWRAAAALLSPDDARGATFLARQPKLRAWVAETQKRVPGWLTELRTLDKWLALPLTVGAGATTAGNEGKLDPSAQDVRHFIRLVTLCHSDHPAERRWLDDAGALDGALTVTGAARAAAGHFRRSQEALMRLYTDKLFDLDLAPMAAGFSGPYRSWARFFRRGYWRACAAMARVSRSGMMPATAPDDVLAARDALADRSVVRAALAQHPGVLGRYDRGIDSDLDAADNAAKLAGEAVRLARSLGHATVPSKLAEALVSGSPPEKIRAALKRLNESFAGWWHLTEELSDVLPMARLPGTAARLDACALSALVHYAKVLQGHLNPFAALTDPLLRQARPTDMPALIADLRQAEEVRAFEASQQADAERWAARLGPAFQGVATDWDGLRKALTWAGRVRECVRTLAADTPDEVIGHAAGTPPVRDLRQALEQYEQALHGLEARFEPPGPMRGGTPLRTCGLDVVLDHLQNLRDQIGTLADWTAWRHLPERFRHLGLGAFWDRLGSADVPRAQVVDVFRKAFWHAWIDAVIQQDPALAGFHGREHEQAIAEFRALDRGMRDRAIARVRSRLDAARPPLDNPEMNVLLLAAKQKTHLQPLRRVFSEISTLLGALKPCLLMDPLSVSRHLPADSDGPEFDLVVVDEAAQLSIAEALPAIARGKQLVIVGDDRAPPPASFLVRHTASDDEAARESVLDACRKAGLPCRMLRSHYRNQREDLIAFANETFYGGKLITFPAPWCDPAAARARLHLVPDGGAVVEGPCEVPMVVQLMLAQRPTHAEGSLGVIVLDEHEQEAIEDELDRQLGKRAAPAPPADGDDPPAFFVKTPAMAQGDAFDRAVLCLGNSAANSRQLGGPGGERVLNVAVTCARDDMVVVSRTRARDLDLPPTAPAGLRDLRRLLDFAERGTDALHVAAPPASPLHEDVRQALRTHGYDTTAHVGLGPIRVDIGVRDADATRYLLGIEFDGPAYGQSPTARDRDRLRPEVLSRLGWRLHRIWAIDWLHRREEEIDRLLNALTAARAANETTQANG